MSLSREDQANLLIVDDDETIQRLLVIAAKDHGWRPRTAGSGMAALEALDDGIEAVVLDHGLPDIDGLQTLERLRSARPDLSVIMLTGLNDAETAVRALRAGAADYLTKPFELKRLFDLLRQIRLDRPEPVAAVTGVTGGGSKLTPPPTASTAPTRASASCCAGWKRPPRWTPPSSSPGKAAPARPTSPAKSTASARAPRRISSR